jgi:AcrR family transcriptional regulator
MSAKRQHPDDRRQQILAAAIVVAARPGGFGKLTRELVAAQVGCASALISRYFGTMPAFRRTIMRAAIAAENLSIIAQGLAAGDPHARKADSELKQRALNSLA